MCRKGHLWGEVDKLRRKTRGPRDLSLGILKKSVGSQQDFRVKNSGFLTEERDQETRYNNFGTHNCLLVLNQGASEVFIHPVR